MSDPGDRIEKLVEKMELLSRQHDLFSQQIMALNRELEDIRNKQAAPLSTPAIPLESTQESAPTPAPTLTPTPEPARQMPVKAKSDLEKYIGENILNKIGIGITIIGVAIGVEYSIEHGLISPATRIALAYLVGMLLLGLGFKLKKTMLSFSAVLVSGAMAILYLSTFSAYAFYNLIPRIPAFALMVVFTALTVPIAIGYNLSVIAHIGLVGAYAVPFLVSADTGNAAALFSYMALINGGILVLSLWKYWKSLFYSSFAISWLIYGVWVADQYDASRHFQLALIFLILFFAIFYTTFLVNKLFRNEIFRNNDVFLLLANSFIFYGLGYTILLSRESVAQFAGIYTALNALVHFSVSMVIFRQKLIDRNIFYFVCGLSLVFITIAIPVQFDGNWVTLVWVGEALLLFWIGRGKQTPFYESLARPLIILAFLSLVQDWMTVYGVYSADLHKTYLVPFFNVNFFSSLICIASFALITRFDRMETAASLPASRLSRIFSFLIPTVLIISIYFSLRMEIAQYWHQLSVDSTISVTRDGALYPDTYYDLDLDSFKTVWLAAYSLLFATGLTWINWKKIRNRRLGIICLGLCLFTLVLFLTEGLEALSHLRASYLEQSMSEYYHRGIGNIAIRYASLAIAALTVITCFQYLHQRLTAGKLAITVDLLLHFAILWMLSSEWQHWVAIMEFPAAGNPGLSIVWGGYSLLLIAIGIRRQKKHLRIAAITLFGITLYKLFFMDIADFGTIAKTMALVSLGALLLVISFLYNRYNFAERARDAIQTETANTKV